MQIRNQTTEQKRKLDKMNMNLNNLEQQLYGDEDSCKVLANFIDMTIETNALVSRLSQIQTSIPVIREKILKLIDECMICCAEQKQNISNNLYEAYVAQCGESNATEKLMKVHKAIDTCIADYDTYTQSQFYKKYCSKEKSAQDSTSLSISELLML